MLDHPADILEDAIKDLINVHCAVEGCCAVSQYLRLGALFMLCPLSTTASHGVNKNFSHQLNARNNFPRPRVSGPIGENGDTTHHVAAKGYRDGHKRLNAGSQQFFPVLRGLGGQHPYIFVDNNFATIKFVIQPGNNRTFQHHYAGFHPLAAVLTDDAEFTPARQVGI